MMNALINYWKQRFIIKNKLQECDQKIKVIDILDSNKIKVVLKKIRLTLKKQQIQIYMKKLKQMQSDKHVIKLLDYYVQPQCQHNNCLYYIIEDIEAYQLRQKLNSFNSKNFFNYCQQFKQICSYLNKINFNSNISLDNFIITQQNQIKLINFGLSHFLNFPDQQYYKPPQSFTQNITDIKNNFQWSIGIILIQIVIGNLIKNEFPNLVPGTDPKKFKELLIKQKNIEKNILSKILSFIEKNRDQLPEQKYIRFKSLDLSHNKQIFQNFFTPDQFISLKQLNLTNCNLENQCAFIIAKNYRSIVILKIGGNQLDDTFVQILQKQKILQKIIELDMKLTNITDISVQILFYTMKNCEKLDLSYTNITQKGIKKLLNLKCLQELVIWSGYNQYIYENLIKNNIENLTKSKNKIKLSKQFQQFLEQQQKSNHKLKILFNKTDNYSKFIKIKTLNHLEDQKIKYFIGQDENGYKISGYQFNLKFIRQRQIEWIKQILLHGNILPFAKCLKQQRFHYLIFSHSNNLNNLESLLKLGKIFVKEEIINYSQSILDALIHLHENKLSHSNLIPQNIYISQSKQIKLANLLIQEENIGYYFKEQVIYQDLIAFGKLLLRLSLNGLVQQNYHNLNNTQVIILIKNYKHNKLFKNLSIFSNIILKCLNSSILEKELYDIFGFLKYHKDITEQPICHFCFLKYDKPQINQKKIRQLFIQNNFIEENQVHYHLLQQNNIDTTTQFIDIFNSGNYDFLLLIIQRKLTINQYKFIFQLWQKRIHKNKQLFVVVEKKINELLNQFNNYENINFLQEKTILQQQFYHRFKKKPQDLQLKSRITNIQKSSFKENLDSSCQFVMALNQKQFLIDDNIIQKRNCIIWYESKKYQKILDQRFQINNLNCFEQLINKGKITICNILNIRWLQKKIFHIMVFKNILDCVKSNKEINREEKNNMNIRKGYQVFFANKTNKKQQWYVWKQQWYVCQKNKISYYE